jgi:hypothetical protein
MAAVAFPVWIVLLWALNQRFTGIPWMAGFMIATVAAGVAALIADRRRFGGQGGGVGPFGRAVLVWFAVFLVLALVVGSGSASGAAVVVIPFAGATFVAVLVELARRAGRRSG